LGPQPSAHRLPKRVLRGQQVRARRASGDRGCVGPNQNQAEVCRAPHANSAVVPSEVGAEDRYAGSAIGQSGRRPLQARVPSRRRSCGALTQLPASATTEHAKVSAPTGEATNARTAGTFVLGAPRLVVALVSELAGGGR